MILSFVCQCKLDSVTLLLGKQDSPTSIGSVSKEELKTQSVEDLRCRIKTIKSVAMVKKCDRVWLDQSLSRPNLQFRCFQQFFLTWIAVCQVGWPYRVIISTMYLQIWCSQRSFLAWTWVAVSVGPGCTGAQATCTKIGKNCHSSYFPRRSLRVSGLFPNISLKILKNKKNLKRNTK